MKTPHSYSLDLLRPHYLKGFCFFRTKAEAEKYKEDHELVYGRIRFSDPIALYTDKVPSGYVLVKKQTLIKRLLSFKIRTII